ncbi:hypothetical protein D0Y65_036049 [Glycine soja]|uniref:Uncharacterized protein n=1 Tax=Glycine soja TaxID=3848 RepID=A0A445HCS3_GLYSO|nr:hypothetical protein D0Y65_036049 [Glycine soja]
MCVSSSARLDYDDDEIKVKSVAAKSSKGEDSFISMKFEENGVASWEKSTSTNAISNISNKKVCVERQVLDKDAKESKSVVEHGKSNNAFRWRKRIGRLVHFIPWKRSNKGGGVGHVEGVKVNRKGWMRTLTKRKTVEQKG